MRFVISAFLILAFLGFDASAGTLERVKETGVFKVGYREDAAPYAYKNTLGEPSGYSVDLCRAVAANIKFTLGLEAISIEYVPLTAENRFDAVKQGQVDILCGATTATLARRELVDFSLGTFVDGASVLFQNDGPGSFTELAGKKVGVRGGTTTQEGLENTLKGLSIDAQVVPVKDHGEGLSALEKGDIQAYFGDRAILVFLAAQSGNQENLRLSSEYFTYEPYALGLQRGDDEFRLLVDQTLSRLYRSGEIVKIYNNSFGAMEPSDVIRALYIINGLPE